MTPAQLTAIRDYCGNCVVRLGYSPFTLYITAGRVGSDGKLRCLPLNRRDSEKLGWFNNTTDRPSNEVRLYKPASLQCMGVTFAELLSDTFTK